MSRVPRALPTKIRYQVKVSAHDPVVDACARAAHEANRAYCIAIGDKSQPSWDDAPNWQRQSAINGVAGVIAGNTPEQSHESWLAEKEADGWKYGEVKDPVAKTHPCMLPYDQLPDEQRAKDSLFIDVVRAVAIALGADVVVPNLEATPPTDVCDDQPITGVDEIVDQVEDEPIVSQNDLCPGCGAPGGEACTSDPLTAICEDRMSSWTDTGEKQE